MFQLNVASVMTVLLVSTACFVLLTAYPMLFWRKTPFIFAMLTSVYVFHLIGMCPSPENEWRSVRVSSLRFRSAPFYVVIQPLVITGFLFVGFAFVTGLRLGNRHGGEAVPGKAHGEPADDSAAHVLFLGDGCVRAF